MSFAGKSVVVTGASSGIGLATARQLQAQGARLVLVGRNADTLRDAIPGDETQRVVSDVATPEGISTLVGALKGHGPFHGWVLAAGAHALRPAMMESRDSLTQMWSANVYASLGLLAQAAKARLLAKEGAVVLFSSAAAQAGGSGLASYAASKGAIEAATRSLAVEFASQKIRVNAVAPGVVRTPMTEAYLTKLTSEQQQRLETDHPLGFGRPEDVAGPVCFLLSDAARWVTGTVLTVDGGYTAH